MGLTYNFANDWIDYVVRQDGTSTGWANMNYISFSTTTPVIDGTNITEQPTADRQNTSGAFTRTTSFAIDNDSDITWTATADWGTVTHVVAWDAASVGNAQWFGALTASEQVFDSDTVSLRAGDLVASVGGDIGFDMAQDLLDAGWGASAASIATYGTVYFGLSTTAPNGDGTNVTEPVGNGYTRAAKNLATTLFDAAASGSTSLSTGQNITWPVATGSWGTITHWVLYDAGAGGNLMMFGALDSSQAVTTDDQVKFGAGNLTITLT